MDRITRHDLKTDKFVEEVAHSVEYIEGHRKQLYIYSGVGLAVILAVIGGWYYVQNSRAERAAALFEAVETLNTRVGEGPVPDGMKQFSTEAERTAAVSKELGGIIQKYSGSDEATVATYLLGANSADQGKLADATRYFEEASKGSNRDYASLAKFSLAELYNAEGKTAEAEKLLRDLMANPTSLVGKDQATVTLARMIARSKPDEARKLL